MKRTERGWPGHYCLGHRCIFHRNTLIEAWGLGIVVSTVGNLQEGLAGKREIVRIGAGHYFETRLFWANFDNRWKDSSGDEVLEELVMLCEEPDADDAVNAEHDLIVSKAARWLRWNGWRVRLGHWLSPEQPA